MSGEREHLDPAHGPDIGSDPETPSGELVKRLSAHAPKTTRYSIQGEVARGGMGAILKVWDEDLRRTLAMKVILGKGEAEAPSGTPPVEPQLLARFLEEAQVTGQLEHPGIVPVHELGLDDTGRVYFTMRLVKGRDLKRIIDLVYGGHAEEEGWTLTKALTVILKVCEAMAYAHEKGVIHRDLKPGNIMVGRFGETYVMDWGLAKIVGRADRRDIRLRPEAQTGTVRTENYPGADDDPASPLLTMDGAVVGTPAYMSPEQARGEIEVVGVRSDVYSVGAMLYHLLTGHMPYVPPGVRASARTVWRWVIEGPPRPVHAIRPDVPAELAAIAEKAMAREPGTRYADTMQMAEDLQAYLEGRVVRAYESGAVAEFRKWVRRNRGMAAASAAAILLALAGLGAVGFVQSRGRRAAEERSYVANIVAADASLRAHEVAEAKRRLDACPEEFRGFEWRHLHLAADTSLAVLRGHEGPVNCVAFSPDGSRIASGGLDETVRIWDAASGAMLGVWKGHERGVSTVAWSPDGSLVASGSWDQTVRLWNPASGEAVAVLRGPETLVDSVVFSPDSARLASSTGDTVSIWDARSGATLLEFRGPQEGVSPICFSPDGTLLASGSWDGLVHLWDARDGRQVRTLRGHEGWVIAIAFSPDGAFLASGSTDKTVRLWDTGSWQALRVFRGHDEQVRSVGFAPGTSLLVSVSDDGTLRTWAPTTGRAVSVIHGHERALSSVAIGPGGVRLATASLDGTVRLWSAYGGGASLALRHEALVDRIAFSPDGARIATGSADETLRIWEARTGEPLLVLEGHGGSLTSPTSLAFSADGTRLASGSTDHSVRTWDARSGAPLRELRGHSDQVVAVAFSPRGGRLASASLDRTARVWDAERGECIHVLRGHGAELSSVAFSPDGSRIVTGSWDQTLRLWDVDTGAPLAEWPSGSGSVHAVAFSHDGSRVLSGSEDGSVRLRDAASGALLATLRGHGSEVISVAFSPDDRRIASGSQDQTSRIWDAQSGESLLVLRNFQGDVGSIAFSPDGTRLAIASAEKIARVFETDAELVHAPLRAVPPLVEALFDRLVLAEDVVAELRRDGCFSGDVRDAAIRIATTRGDQPKELNDKCWRVVQTPDGDPPTYAKALRWAETACRMKPDEGFWLNTLGLAQYRVGDYESALATLTRSDDLNRGHPADVAFLAMAEKRLGREELAQASIARLHGLMQDPRWSQDEESKGFLREADALVSGTPGASTSPR